MNWQEVCDDRSLGDIPYRVELNEWGQVVLTRIIDKHSLYKGRIMGLFSGLEGASGGHLLSTFAVETSGGVYVFDVAWGSREYHKRLDPNAYISAECPEVAVEIRLPNLQYLKKKKEGFFERGAKEVWLCDDDGGMHFFNPQGELERSELFGEFPGHIDIDVV